MVRFRFVALLAILVTSCALAADYRPLRGEYRIGGRTLVDAPPDEPRDTHLHLFLTGSAARDLYEAMKTRPRRDACSDDGTLVKTAGEMQCRRSGERFECAFAVDLARQRIVLGAAC